VSVDDGREEKMNEKRSQLMIDEFTEVVCRENL
jgi:hypothetical protein